MLRIAQRLIRPLVVNHLSQSIGADPVPRPSPTGGVRRVTVETASGEKVSLTARHAVAIAPTAAPALPELCTQMAALAARAWWSTKTSYLLGVTFVGLEWKNCCVTDLTMCRGDR